MFRLWYIYLYIWCLLSVLADAPPLPSTSCVVTGQVIGNQIFLTGVSNVPQKDANIFWEKVGRNGTSENILGTLSNKYNKTKGRYEQYKEATTEGKETFVLIISNVTGEDFTMYIFEYGACKTNVSLSLITSTSTPSSATITTPSVTSTSTPSSATITTPSDPSTELKLGLSVGLPCTCVLSCLVLLYCICKKKHKRCIDLLNCKKCRRYELADSCDNCATDNKEMDVSPKEHDTQLSDSEAPKQNGICNSDEPEEHTQNIHDHPVRQNRTTKNMQPKQDGPSKVIPSGN